MPVGSGRRKAFIVAAIVLFALHFPGVLAWTPVFFGMQDMWGGLYVLGYVVASLVLVILAFWRVRKRAAVLLLPYLAWVCFATVLNYQFIVENPDGGTTTETSGAVKVTL